LDENLDWRLRRDLPGHSVESVPLIGWAGLKNGALLKGAEQRFDVLVTMDSNPVSIITKNYLVTRDLDLLKELAAHRAVMVMLSINSLDSELARKLEPRAASPKLRLAAVEALANAGVPVGVMVAPVIPALTDHEIPNVLAAAGAAGAGFAGTEILRLPLAVAPIFQEWLEQHVPDRKEKIVNRIRDIRGGRLNDPRFGHRMGGEGNFAEQVFQMFRVGRRKAGMAEQGPRLSTAAFRRSEGAQLGLEL